MDLYEKQIKLEEESLALGIDNYIRTRDDSEESELPPGVAMTKHYIPKLSEYLEEWIGEVEAGKAKRHGTMCRKLKQFDIDTVSFLVLRSVLNGVNNTVQKVGLQIAGLLEDLLNYERFKAENPGLYQTLDKDLKRYNQYRRRREIMIKMQKWADVNLIRWDKTEKMKLGQSLIQMAEIATGIIEVKRVRSASDKRTTINQLQLTAEAQDWLERQHARCELLSPVFLPMVVEPTPWESPYDGGYLTRACGRLKLIKTPNRHFLEELRNFDLSAVYAAVNAVQSTAWRINKPVLAVMEEVWEAGGGQQWGLPERDNIPLPAKPHDIETNEVAKKDWKRKAARVHSYNARIVSKRKSLIQKMWIARKMSEFEAIYYPHCLDYRGRLYPIPAHGPTPQSSEEGRALLEYSEGKPVGREGGRWLMHHAAGLAGVDKCTYEERVAWVIQHKDLIIDSAERPLDGEKFWAKQEKPWQFLAVAFELKGYWEQGEDFVSHLNIEQDGSNNGTQHLAAMLRDYKSGKAVNLTREDTPQDIYMDVRDVVEMTVRQDADSSDKKTMDIARWWLDGDKITRKIVKRPVMTLAYGSGRYGMQDMILDELKKAAEKGKLGDAGVKDLWPYAHYLSHVTYAAIGQVVVAARQAMEWLQEVAQIIAKNNLPVRWMSPAGLPILQAYRKMDAKRINTIIAGIRLRSTIRFPLREIDSRKQAQGISPNFTHSCDAAHLMLTVESAKEQGIGSFGMIHDSFGTHAADSTQLAHILREQFIRVHDGTGVLERFRRDIINQIPEELRAEIPPLPEMGDLDLSEVLNSLYFFA